MNEEQYFEKIAEYKLLAKHEVGQNFLIDADAAKKIVDLAEIEEADNVLEIGSGAGSLSYFIEQSASKADLIDIDEGLVQKLKEDYANSKTVSPMVGNAMKWDYEKYTKIISNLPYYITSAILERVLLTAKKLKTGVFMVQKEVVSRLKAPQGNEDYSPLGLLIRYRADFVKGFNVPRTSFAPAPHVDSSVFVLKIKNDNLEEANKLYSLASALFLHKRKTIYNNLTQHLKDSAKAKEVLEKAQIKPNLRPQEISLEGYLSLLKAIS